MKKQLSRFIILLVSSMFILNGSYAQQSTLEWTLDGSDNNAFGANTTPVVVTFLKDALNANFSTVFTNNTPTLTATVSLRSQQRSTTLTGTSTVVPGMTFGGRTTASTGGTPGIETIGSAQVYNVFGTNISVQPPKNGMYISSPSSASVAPSDDLGNGAGLGLDVQAITGATGPSPSSSGGDANFGVSLYNSVEPLFDANLAKDGRYYYGELVITFNRPVKNPVVHVGGLGGSYNYQPTAGGTRKIAYFTTELELQNAGLSSIFMAGNPFLNLVGNNILNSSASPNGGSYDDGTNSFGYSNYGAASGSVKVVGTVQVLVYKVYIRGSANSDFNFSQSQSAITSATRDPHNGDFWYLGISLDKPTQQISGTVLNDADGLNDIGGGDINKSAGVANPGTNVGGTLYANLLNTSGLVVATTPISSDGSYLFDNVPVGAYSVQLTTISGTGTFASPGTAVPTLLPLGWVNTGEFVSDVTTIGSDGTPNGRLAVPAVASQDIKVQNNFGIERLPESINYTSFIPTPQLNSVITLNSFVGNPEVNLPILSGSDPEDQPTTGVLTTKIVQITTLPTNSQLLYNGVPVVTNQIIPNFNPALLKIKFSIATAAGQTQFNYAYVDAAGKPDPTPATYFIGWPNNGTLPIVLAEFAATKNNCLANINWKTSSELNADKFVIEYSTATNNSFYPVGEVTAKGSNSSLTGYQFNYPMESGVIYYFRLKMVKKDGTYTYSLMIPLTCNEKQPLALVPNPTMDAFRILGLEKGKNTITIFGNDGKLVRTEIISNGTSGINISNFAPGVYVVRIQNENGSVETRRVVKK